MYSEEKRGRSEARRKKGRGLTRRNAFGVAVGAVIPPVAISDAFAQEPVDASRGSLLCTVASRIPELVPINELLVLQRSRQADILLEWNPDIRYRDKADNKGKFLIIRILRHRKDNYNKGVIIPNIVSRFGNIAIADRDAQIELLTMRHYEKVFDRDLVNVSHLDRVRKARSYLGLDSYFDVDQSGDPSWVNEREQLWSFFNDSRLFEPAYGRLVHSFSFGKSMPYGAKWSMRGRSESLDSVTNIIGVLFDGILHKYLIEQ